MSPRRIDGNGVCLACQQRRERRRIDAAAAAKKKKATAGLLARRRSNSVAADVHKELDNPAMLGRHMLRLAEIANRVAREDEGF